MGAWGAQGSAPARSLYKDLPGRSLRSIAHPKLGAGHADRERHETPPSPLGRWCWRPAGSLATAQTQAWGWSLSQTINIFFPEMLASFQGKKYSFREQNISEGEKSLSQIPAFYPANPIRLWASSTPPPALSSTLQESGPLLPAGHRDTCPAAVHLPPPTRSRQTQGRPDSTLGRA